MVKGRQEVAKETPVWVLFKVLQMPASELGFLDRVVSSHLSTYFFLKS